MDDNLARLERCLANRETVLNLGNCGLNDYDLSFAGEAGRVLAKCTHLEVLILSNTYYGWMLHEAPAQGMNARYHHPEKDVSWEKGYQHTPWHQPKDYFTIPSFRPLLTIGEGKKGDNYLTVIPEVVANLHNLKVFVCGGSSLKKWAINDVEPLRLLEKLKTLVLSNNRLTHGSFLHWFPALTQLDLGNNNIKQLGRVTPHTRLEYLDLSNNQLKNAYEINSFPKLRWLSLANNRLKSMVGVHTLPLLQVVDLSNNKIDTYKPFVGGRLLEKLNVSHNELGELNEVGELPRLKYLFARSNRLMQVDGVPAMQKLEVLDLSNNMISHLPAGLPALSELHTLDISNNGLQVLEHVFELKQLRLLNAATNRIHHISCEQDCASLEKLQLSNNRLSELKVLPYFPNLKSLYASGNNLEELVCDHNECLTEIVLSHNKINNLQFARDCIHLAYLDVEHNKVTTVDDMGCLPKLAALYAKNNRISDSLSLQNFPALERADFSSNNISLVEDLNGLSCLQSINLQDNIIKDPGHWKDLPALERINLKGNRLTSLRGKLAFLPRLKTLELSRNQLGSIPDLQLFPQLERLILSNNNIKKFEKQVAHPTLREFCVDQNGIEVIEDVASLFHYKKLDLSYNPISKIIGLSDLLKSSNGIYLRRNDNLAVEMKWYGKNLLLKSPYFNIPRAAAGDSDSIRNWIIAMDEGGFLNKETRIILLGNGKSGKTALSYFLRKGNFYKLDDRSHGILVEKWGLVVTEADREIYMRIADAISKYKIREEEWDAVCNILVPIWDFGGQENYHATHRFFMSSDVLYLVVWDQDLEHQDESNGNYPKEYWKKIIEYYAPGSPILFVQNRADKEYTVDGETTFKICTYNEEDTESVAQYARDMNTLKKGILKKIAGLPDFARFIPKVYEDIETVIKNLGKPYISFAEFEAICKKADDSGQKIMSNPSQVESLLEYLDNIGSIVSFRRRKRIHDELLNDYIFTDADWLTKIIYKVLINEKKGFDLSHVEKQVAAYGIKAEVWIKLMQHFGLIFEVKSRAGNKYIAPQYLPRECENETALEHALMDKDMVHSFTVRYPGFMPQSNFLRLVAHYGSEHIRGLYWNNGLVFFKNKKTVFLERDVEEQKIKVKVQDNDRSVVIDVLERILEVDSVEGLEVSIDEVNFVSLEVLKNKMANGNLEIDATNGKTLDVKNFSFLFRGQALLIQHKGQRKTKFEIVVVYANKERRLMGILINGVMEHLNAKSGYEFEFRMDQAIDSGPNWRATTQSNIAQADGALVLVSAGLMASSHIRKEELGELFSSISGEGFLILPVLLRNCDFAGFEDLSGLQFFKAYYDDYGYNSPGDRRRFMPFDLLGENERTKEYMLNEYYKNLADMIFRAVSNNMSVK
jgi:Leucine-rich repeat (LRR) protein/GTPase SAR1 family protein